MTVSRGFEVIVPYGPDAKGRGYQRRAAQFIDSLDSTTVEVSKGVRRSLSRTAKFVVANRRMPLSVVAFQARWDFTPRTDLTPVFFTSRSVPREARRGFVIDFVDSISSAYDKRASRCATALGRWFWRREADLLHEFDSDVLGRASAACAVSPRDAQALGVRCRVIGMWPEAAKASNGDLRKEAVRSILFFGHLGFPPNAEAVHWIRRGFAPTLDRAIKVRIAGRGAPRALRGSPLYIGEYRDLVDLVDSSTVAIAPVETGSGLQTKVVEAAALGVPTVVTPFVAAGLASPLPQGIVVCERRAESFAAAVAGIDDSEAVRADLREWVARHYAFAAIAPLWRELVQSMPDD